MGQTGSYKEVLKFFESRAQRVTKQADFGWWLTKKREFSG